jgi:hypothetical protein
MILFHFGRSGSWSGDPLGFFTPFQRRFLGGSELAPFFGKKEQYSDIFAGPMLKHRAPLENDSERLNPRWVASTMTPISSAQNGGNPLSLSPRNAAPFTQR